MCPITKSRERHWWRFNVEVDEDGLWSHRSVGKVQAASLWPFDKTPLSFVWHVSNWVSGCHHFCRVFFFFFFILQFFLPPISVGGLLRCLWNFEVASPSHILARCRQLYTFCCCCCRCFSVEMSFDILFASVIIFPFFQSWILLQPYTVDYLTFVHSLCYFTPTFLCVFCLPA